MNGKLVLKMMVWTVSLTASIPVFAAPVPCVCSFKPLPRFAAAPLDPSQVLDSQVILKDLGLPTGGSKPWTIAEGPPPDDKGTPGNRGECGSGNCGSAQSRAIEPIQPTKQPIPTCDRSQCPSPSPVSTSSPTIPLNKMI
jgi:hypothetical protein